VVIVSLIQTVGNDDALVVASRNADVVILPLI